MLGGTVRPKFKRGQNVSASWTDTLVSLNTTQGRIVPTGVDSAFIESVEITLRGLDDVTQTYAVASGATMVRDDVEKRYAVSFKVPCWWKPGLYRLSAKFSGYPVRDEWTALASEFGTQSVDLQVPIEISKTGVRHMDAPCEHKYRLDNN
ncbi:hypothetical protein HDU90_000983 [Geranomyces variabilis]|nr:hypothetical protein HDU90_000983 [Geranomyces variabilis]